MFGCVFTDLEISQKERGYAVTKEVVHKQIVKVLDELTRQNLAADGFSLQLKEVDSQGIVKVLIEAQQNACIDCLVPDEMLKGIIEMGIRRVFPELKYVELIKNFS